MWLPLYVHSPPGEHTHMGDLDCSRCDVQIGREWRWALSGDPGFLPWSLSDEPLPHVEYRMVRVRFEEFASTTRNPHTGERGRTTYWIAAVLIDGSYDDLLRLAEFRPHPPRPVSRSQFRASMDSPPTFTLEQPPLRCIPTMVDMMINTPAHRERLADIIHSLSPADTPFMTLMQTQRSMTRLYDRMLDTVYAGLNPAAPPRDLPTADTAPPEESKPLAPLPDWLDKVDSILAEHTTPQPGEP